MYNTTRIGLVDYYITKVSGGFRKVSKIICKTLQKKLVDPLIQVPHNKGIVKNSKIHHFIP